MIVNIAFAVFTQIIPAGFPTQRSQQVSTFPETSSGLASHKNRSLITAAGLFEILTQFPIIT